jgi:hypothetical protein
MDGICNDIERTVMVNTIIDEILGRRKEISRMNLPYLWDSSRGLYLHKYHDHRRGTSGTRDLVESFGYDTKQVMHAIRIIKVIERFAENGFSDFGAAIWFEGKEREELLGIKAGSIRPEDVVQRLESEMEALDRLKEEYRRQEPDTATKDWLDSKVMELVRTVAMEGCA